MAVQRLGAGEIAPKTAAKGTQIQGTSILQAKQAGTSTVVSADPQASTILSYLQWGLQKIARNLNLVSSDEEAPVAETQEHASGTPKEVTALQSPIQSIKPSER